MTISLLVSLFLIWILFFWFWRDYRVDLCRERLFVIRQDLFDLALERKLDFDSPSYGLLRITINATIQFAHRFTLLEVIGIAIVGRGTAGDKISGAYRDRWDAAVHDLDPGTRQDLEAIRSRVYFQVFEQVVMTSAILMFSTISLFLVLFLVAIKRRLQSAIARRLYSGTASRMADEFDSRILVASH